MKNYLPPKIPNPKAAAERRKRILAVLPWLLAIPPVLFALMAYGYSDQAPAFLRAATITIDRLFGSPVWTLIKP
jgi:hypothetical protein